MVCKKLKGEIGSVPRNRCLDATVEQRADQVPIFAPDVVRISCGCRGVSLVTMLSEQRRELQNPGAGVALGLVRPWREFEGVLNQ